MQKEAAWLLEELTQLIGKEVIDEATAARLRAHYAAAAKEAGSRLGWGMILLATGGAALVGLGIILIFAHNWENWTPDVRVGLSLLPLLAGQGASAWALRRGDRVWSEAAGLFTAIAIGASIALIAQTYQMGGDLPRFLLTWLLLAIPLVYLLDSSAVASLCWLLALGWTMAGAHWMWGRAHEEVPGALRLPLFLILFALPLPHLLRHIRLDPAGARVAWMLRTALAAVAIGLVFVGHSDYRDALFLVYASLAATAALAGQRYFAGVHGAWGNPLRSVGRFGVFLLAVIATSDDALRELDWPLQSSLLVLPLVLGGAAGWLAWLEFGAGDRLLAPLLGVFAPVMFLLPLLADSSTPLAVILAHAYALALAAAMIRTGLTRAQFGLANQGVALIAAMILVRFFDSDLSYVVRGVGFIVTGAGFFVATLWLRRRVKATS
ncbi:MAG: DUF2157 domain-containing protein [Nevskiaceae bacterium]